MVNKIGFDKHPIVYTRMDTYPHKYIIPYLRSIKSYSPTPYLWNRHLETIIPQLLKLKIPCKITEEIVPVKALKSHLLDGECAIQWSPLPETSAKHTPHISPIILICPGLTGDISAAYIRRLISSIWSEGWQ